MPNTAGTIPIAKGRNVVSLLPGMANRHGLVAGATGTGKTTTLRVLAENFSAIGVPVFLADIKGDLSGIAKAGGDNPKVLQRAKELGLPEVRPEGYPVAF
jgi:DNA helicase HerA-like ATPase